MLVLVHRLLCSVVPHGCDGKHVAKTAAFECKAATTIYPLDTQRSLIYETIRITIDIEICRQNGCRYIGGESRSVKFQNVCVHSDQQVQLVCTGVRTCHINTRRRTESYFGHAKLL